MSQVNVTIEEAAVTAVHEFNSFKGYGADFYVEAQSSNSTVYLQVVVYDDEARSYCRYIHEGDYVRITGDLKTKPYRKKDGTEGLSLIIERPVVFSKIVSGNSKPQLQQQTEKSIETVSSEEQNQDENAVTADNTSYYDQFKDYSDVDPFDYYPEELEKIIKHIEEYKKQNKTSSAADTAPQELNAETASQYKPESSQYEDASGRTQYPPDISDDDEEEALY